MHKKGQSLIEVVVAMTILGMIMALVALAAYTSVRRARESELRTQATFLAQEGMEIVKNFKDGNWGINEDGLSCSSETRPGGASCVQNIFKITPDIEFYKLSLLAPTTYCLIPPTVSLREWYLEPSALPCATSAQPSVVGGANNFERLVTVTNALTTAHSAGVGNSCTIATSALCPRRVEVKVSWCQNGEIISAACLKDNVVLVAYFEKWKEPNG